MKNECNQRSSALICGLFLSFSALGRHLRRRSAHRPLQLQAKRGYASLYIKSVLQAEQGCDFDFLRKA